MVLNGVGPLKRGFIDNIEERNEPAGKNKNLIPLHRVLREFNFSWQECHENTGQTKKVVIL